MIWNCRVFFTAFNRYFLFCNLYNRNPLYFFI